jgi:hypothetical protein
VIEVCLVKVTTAWYGITVNLTLVRRARTLSFLRQVLTLNGSGLPGINHECPVFKIVVVGNGHQSTADVSQQPGKLNLPNPFRHCLAVNPKIAEMQL